MNRPNIINFSGGVQSTALILASMRGEIDRADCAILSDTGWERKTTYDTIEQVLEYAKHYDFPVHIVRHPTMTLKEHILERSAAALTENPSQFVHVPTYILDKFGKVRKGKKQCTDHFKIRPIRKKVVDLFGETYCQWFGFSLEEVSRISPSHWVKVTHRYPLIEKRWRRGDCIEYLKSIHFPIPTKSSCIGCPLHSAETWQNLTSAERVDAISVDDKLQDIKTVLTYKSKADNKSQVMLPIDIPDEQEKSDPLPNHLHASAKPLREVIDKDFDPGYDLETEDCGGSCFL